jgi:hypothetical protein
MKFWSMLLGLAVAAILATGLTAQEKGKEVELKGKLTCAKCTLKEPGITACCNVLVVKEGEKEVKYFLSPNDGGAKATYHKEICPAGTEKEATVKGTVIKDKDKMVFQKGAEVTFKK